MRCFRRSTRSFAERFGIVLALAVGVGHVRVAAIEDPSLSARVQAAVADAVAERLGRSASARVTSLVDVRIVGTPGRLVAIPDAKVRTGKPGRFAIVAVTPDGGRVRIGEATAVVAATGDVARATHALVRGMVLSIEDVEIGRADLVDLPLTPVPLMDELAGARVTRDLPAGARVTHADISTEPAVRSGDVVRAAVRIRGVEIVATALAVQGGQRHEVIRVMNPESRQVFRGVITGPKEVEVLDVR